LDVNVIRNDPEAIRTMLRNRTYSEEVLDSFLELDAAWRGVVEEGNRLRKQRNEASVRISKLKGPEKAEAVAEMKSVASRIGELESQAGRLEAERDELILLIPNIPHESVPVGDCYDKNRMVMEHGKVRRFDFQPKDHITLGEDLDIIAEQTERMGMMTGQSICGLSDGASYPLRTLVTKFRAELEERMEERKAKGLAVA